MTDLDRAIYAVEHGLLVKADDKDHPPRVMELRERMAYHHVPGLSIALVDQEEVAWAKWFGVVEAGGEEPVTPETIFQAASISKPVTAMIALRLVEAGLLDLDADVNDVLRSWKVPASKYTQPRRDGACPKVTLRGLLSHTAGLSPHGYTGYRSEAKLPTLLQVLNGEPPANSKPVRVRQTPGKSFWYSGGGYLVAQQMIEDVTGRPLAALAQEWIFDRLGMANSTFVSRLPQAYLPQAATAHNSKGKAVPGKWHIYPEQAPASLWTTPSDLARLVVEVLKSYHNRSNLVLSTEMTREMLTPQVSWIGLGFPIVNRDGTLRFEHPGWNVGFRSLMVGCPDAGQGAIVMTNGENGERLWREAMRALSEIYGWLRAIGPVCGW